MQIQSLVPSALGSPPNPNGHFSVELQSGAGQQLHPRVPSPFGFPPFWQTFAKLQFDRLHPQTPFPHARYAHLQASSSWLRFQNPKPGKGKVKHPSHNQGEVDNETSLVMLVALLPPLL